MSRCYGNAPFKTELPAVSNHSTDPLILDSKTFLINTAGWKSNASLGIYRGYSMSPELAFGRQTMTRDDRSCGDSANPRCSCGPALSKSV